MLKDNLENKYNISIYEYILLKIKYSNKMMRKILGLVGKLNNEERILRYECEKYFGFTVGKHSYGYKQFNYSWVNIESIGSFCSIAKNVSITGLNHPYTYITTSPVAYHPSRGFVEQEELPKDFYKKNRKVIIGNDVWIGDNVTILPSVKIGDGVIIGAGSVVTKDIPDYSIVVGVPARVIKYRFSKSEIDKLGKIKWWEWSDDILYKNIKLFKNKDLFLKTFNE